MLCLEAMTLVTTEGPELASRDAGLGSMLLIKTVKKPIMALHAFKHSSGEAKAGGLPVWASLGYIMRHCTQAGDSNVAPVSPDLGCAKSFGHPPKSFAFPKQDLGGGEQAQV